MFTPLLSRGSARPWLLAVVAVIAVIAVLSWTSLARAADISVSVTYPTSGATVDTSIPASTTITTFSPGTALVAGDKIIMRFPAGTWFEDEEIGVGDFLIAQGAAGGGVTGAATAPSDAVANRSVGTITLTIASASLSTGDSAGEGTVTVATSTTGGNEVTHPTTATTTGTFGVETTDSGSSTKDEGSISDVTFVAGAYDAARSTVATSAAEVVYGSNTTVSLTAVDPFFNPILNLVVGNVSFGLGGGESGGLFAGATHGGSGVYNATFTATAFGTASTLTATYNSGTNAVLGGSPTITVTAKALTVTGITAENKIYDQGTIAMLSGSGTLVGVINHDDVTVGGVAAGTFANANVGEGKTVTVSGLILDGADAGNYTLTQPTTTADITARGITVTAVTQTREYDGTTASSGTPTVTSGSLADGDTIAAITQTFDNRNAGTDKVLTPAGVVTDGNDGTNYALTLAPVATGEITTRALTVTAVTQTREYDGTTASSGTPEVTSGSLADGDEIAAITQTFDNRNVDTNKVLTPAGVVTDGNDGGNYALTLAPVATGELTAHAITVTAQTDTKVYSGTVASAVTPEVTGGAVQTGDTPAFIQSFNLTGAGTDKLILPSGVVTDGNGGTNYTYTFVNDNTGVITPRPVTAPGVTAVNKVYDNTTTATLDLSTPGLTAIEAWETDTVTVDAAGYTATFASADVDSGIAVTVTGLALVGAGAENYTLTQPGDLTANITQAPLTVTGVTAANKVYDSNTTATVTASGAAFVGVLGGDTVTVGGTATGTFADADVGADKTVAVAGITATGTHSLNYTVTQPTATADITAAASAPTSDPTPTEGPTVTLEDEQSTPVAQDEPTEVQTEASDGSTATVDAPANALPAGSTLTAASVGNLAELTSQAPPPGGTAMLVAFVLEVKDAGGNAIEGDFAAPVQLEFNVPASSAPAGATSGQMVLAFWNGSSWTEVEASVTVNTDGSLTINASVDHFTIFSVQHQPDRGTFFPLPVFPVSFVVWQGGGYALLDDAVGIGSSAWVMVNGRFYGYTVGLPAFVNATFLSMFPAGIASNTAVVVARPD